MPPDLLFLDLFSSGVCFVQLYLAEMFLSSCPIWKCFIVLFLKGLTAETLFYYYYFGYMLNIKCNLLFYLSVFKQPTHLANFNQVQSIQYSALEEKDRKGMLQLNVAGAPEVKYTHLGCLPGAHSTKNGAHS